MKLRNTQLLSVALTLTLAASAQSALIDLSGGTGGQSGQFVYTAGNGTTVTSNRQTWSNTNFYYMEYLFNGSLGTSLHTDYWLSNGSAPYSLVFDLDQTYKLDFIRAYPYSNSGRLAPSDYQIDISDDGGSTVTDITGLIDTSSDVAGTFRDHIVNQKVNYVRFTLTKIGSLNGASFNEIQLFGEVLQVPEPSSFLLLGLGMLGMARHARRKMRRRA